MSIRNKIEAVVMILVIILTLVIYTLAYTQNGQMQWAKQFDNNLLNQKTILEFEKLELATTDQQRQIGYMNRESICSRCGMLFVFEKSQPLSFWMKNTLVPLKITFIDENGVVINSEIGQPKVTSPAVNSLRPAKYVLEVPIDSPIDLKPNQQIDIKKMLTEN